MGDAHYEWEKEVEKRLKEGLYTTLPDNLSVVGVCIENTETGEGALVMVPWVHMDGSVVCADIWSDISGDAEELYETSKAAMWEDWGKGRRQ